jgi:parallel beta-helix repeat protein
MTDTSLSAIDCYGLNISNSCFYNGSKGMILDGCRDVKVHDLDIRKQNGNGLEINNCKDLAVTKCKFSNNDGKGILLRKSGGNLTITDSFISENTREGIMITDISKEISVSGNVIKFNEKEGLAAIDLNNASIIIRENSLEYNDGFNVKLERVSGLIFTRNSIIGSHAGGLIAGQLMGREVIIGNNSFIDNPNYQLELQGVDSINILDNRIEGGDRGVYLGSDSDKNIMENNSILNSSAPGILVGTGCDENRISSNFIDNCLDTGIYLFRASDNKILENIIDDPSGHGVVSIAGSRTNASGNRIIGCNLDGIHFTQEIGPYTISWNYIRQCRKHGIVLSGLTYKARIIGNDLEKNGGGAVSLSSVEDSIILSNRLGTIEPTISFDNCWDILITDNIIISS